ncbi:hypothetical protein [Roseimicrobium sp. ORNL1]|nr:hypothetical protein [Roseimicrobium sp. ORNL1]
MQDLQMKTLFRLFKRLCHRPATRRPMRGPKYIEWDRPEGS